MIPTEEMVIKVRAACEARQNKAFVVVARTDARARYGLKEAIERGRAYAAAGADIIFIEAYRMCDVVDRSELLRLFHFYELEERLYGPIRESESSWRDELQRRTKGTGK